jgi:Queuosine biosynthesis protein QueC
LNPPKALCQVCPTKTIHVPVWVNKESNLGREHTQRTRSLLYSALGVVVAESIKAGGVRFFENGIVSFNIPVADEVLRARASRTTHPAALDLFTKLYRKVLGREFEVDNPFIFKTKTEVVASLTKNNAQHLIAHTCSCAHTAFKSRNQWHCGTCSQCIDRRIAVLAAGEEQNDPKVDYVSDVFTGARKAGYEQSMAVNYACHASELHQLSADGMTSKFNRDLSRAARPFSQRHADSVSRIISQQIGIHGHALFEGKLEKTSMLALVAGQEHITSTWHRYAGRIAHLLTVGLPAACQSSKPQNEPHLQEICDGILKAGNTDLVREFPFMSWSASKTKPDWSNEPLKLWVELKYVRQKADVRTITEDIAADITKLGLSLDR